MRALLLSLVLVITACAPKTPQAVEYAPAQRAPAMASQQGKAAAPSLVPVVTERLEPVVVKKVVKVGLLLPLTGRNAELGRAMQDAATVSLFDKYARLPVSQQATKVELITKDTGDSPEKARAAMSAALSEGAQLIIGPIHGDQTEAVAGIAAAKHVPVLSFSNNRAKKVPGTYLMGFSPQEQAMRVLRYAALKEHKRIAVLVPKSPTGDEVLAAAREVAKDGAFTVTEAQYVPQAVGLEAALTTLFPAGAAPYDGIFLAETGTPLQSILRALSARGVTGENTRFMGIGVWDDVTLLSQVNLDGAWLASSDPAATSQYEQRFRSTYGYSPVRISSLAYDAVALAVTLAVAGRDFTAENLSAEGGFTGPANGIFRLREGGLAERGLAVLRVQNGGMIVIAPAPKTF